MPRFVVTTGSAFEPFTYDELAKPLIQMQTAQNAAEEKFDEYAANADAIRTYISNNPNDSDARALYEDYMGRLNTLRDNLYNQGYNSQTRRDLAAARQGYNRDIARIATEIKNRQARSEAYRKFKIEHPDQILGYDPSRGGLNDYLRDPLYGTDYYSYSGTDFAKEVATEMKARAAEMMKDPRIIRDPRMKGYLTQVIDEDFTNKQVDDAYHAAVSKLTGDKKDISGSLDPAAKILYDALLTQAQHTGAPLAVESDRLSEDELTRLLGYGRIGAASAINKPTVNNLKDLEQEQKWALGRIGYQHKLARKDKEETPSVTIGDTNIVPGGDVGPERSKWRKKLDKWLHKDKDHDVVTRNGSTVSSVAQASEIVYSGRDRAAVAEKVFGFDPLLVNTGRFVKPEKYTTGQVVDSRGILYTRYNPKDHTVQVSRSGRDGTWDTDVKRTGDLNAFVDRVNSAAERYRTTDPDLFEMAQYLSPDKQRVMYDDGKIAHNIPITMAEHEVLSRPENSMSDYAEAIVAREGTDNGAHSVRNRLAGIMTSGSLFKFDEDGNITNDKNALAYNGKPSHGIHLIDSGNRVEFGAVTDPSKLFKLDKEGRIDNIAGISLDKRSLDDNYFVVRLKNSNQKVAIGVNSLDSVLLEQAYNKARATLNDYLNQARKDGVYTPQVEQLFTMEVLKQLSQDIINLEGFALNIQTQGNTKQQNINGILTLDVDNE